MANPQHLMPNTQHPPLAITLCELCMPEAFCELETVSLKPPWPPCALWEKELPSVLFVCHLIEWVCSFSHRKTQMNRTHSIPQKASGIQISQNLTAIFSWNALCALYVGGVLWARNCALKTSVTSVCSVRDKPPQRISSVLSHMEGAFYLSQIYTEEQNTQSFTETLSQPISQSVTANLSWKASVNSVCRRPSVGSKPCA